MKSTAKNAVLFVAIMGAESFFSRKTKQDEKEI